MTTATAPPLIRTAPQGSGYVAFVAGIAGGPTAKAKSAKAARNKLAAELNLTGKRRMGHR